MSHDPKPATEHTRARNAAVAVDLDPADFERATRGLVAQIDGPIVGPIGTAWNTADYDFIREADAAPDTVNPSLWRQAELNSIHGLFEVAPGLWQARGYDLSNITFIEGTDGWVVVDPLTSTATARASLELANRHLGERPVTAVLYTHAHIDHFGGVLGVTSEAEVKAGNCRIIAPEGFLGEAIAENLLAGPAMSRRALFQFGMFLPKGPRGQVDAGLGKGGPLDRPGLLAPTEEITHTGQELILDGVRIRFQLTPGTEAPVEMNFSFPDHNWLCMAENCTHTMHNLVPIRGAQVRDALAWSKYIGEAIELFGTTSDLVFASHHWPRWGNRDVVDFLQIQRDLYRYLHDQTLRLLNDGLTPDEIADAVELPPEFAAHGHARPYYGDVGHNVRAVYQRYLSWYDGNPAHLDRHAPSEAGRRYVEFMGGAEQLLAEARRSFDEGDYRWVVEVVNHLVFAQPDNVAARNLQADSLEQLGYQHESAIFRNAYLNGAHELRNGAPNFGARPSPLAAAITVEQVFDAMAIRVDAEAAADVNELVNLTVTDAGAEEAAEWVLGVTRRTLWSVAGRHDEAAVVTMFVTRPALVGLYQGTLSIDEAIEAGGLALDGDRTAVERLYGLLVPPLAGWAVVEP